MLVLSDQCNKYKCKYKYITDLCNSYIVIERCYRKVFLCICNYENNNRRQ